MYARITTYQANPDRQDEMVAKIDEVKAQIKALAGAKTRERNLRAC